MSATKKRKTKPHSATKHAEKSMKRPKSVSRTSRAEKKPAIEIQPKASLQTTPPAPVPSAPPKEASFFLVIRIRGSFGVPPDVERTLQNLRVKDKFNATFLEKSPSALGMLRRAKDYITWGEINSDAIAKLLRKRAKLQTGGRLTDKHVNDLLAQKSIETLAIALANGEIPLKTLWQKGLKPVFKLHPPSGGFSGTMKRPFDSRGELGYRQSRISILMSKMT